MKPRFARALERLHRVGNDRLHDSVGDYQSGECAIVRGVRLAIDRDLRELGAEGAFQAGAVLVEFDIGELRAVERGGVFIVGRKRYIVDHPINNDGYRILALCMEAP